MISNKNKENISKEVWVCNECNTPNYTLSVSNYDIENELVSCIDCGCLEFHVEKIISLNK